MTGTRNGDDLPPHGHESQTRPRSSIVAAILTFIGGMILGMLITLYWIGRRPSDVPARSGTEAARSTPTPAAQIPGDSE